MELSPIYLQSKSNNNSPAFGSIATGLGKSALRPELRQNFSIFKLRTGYNIDRLADDIIALQNKYKKPINITVCGCSDGTKAVELQMGMIKRFTELGIDLDKLPNIKAFDIDGDIVKIAQKGRLNISDREFEELTKLYPPSIYPFFSRKGELIDIPGNDIAFIEKSLNTKYRYSYQYNPKYFDKIEIYQGDLFKELPKLESDIPQIISSENIAIYFEDEKQKEIGKILRNVLAPESKILVGTRDKHNSIIDASNTFPNAFVKELLQKGFMSNRNISDIGCALEKLYCDPETGFYLNFAR